MFPLIQRLRITKIKQIKWNCLQLPKYNILGLVLFNWTWNIYRIVKKRIFTNMVLFYRKSVQNHTVLGKKKNANGSMEY